MDTEKKETKEINKLSLLIMAVVILVLIIAGAGYYIYQQKQQMNDLVQAYDLDRNRSKMSSTSCPCNMKVINSRWGTTH